MRELDDAARVLGELEERVMDALWRAGEALSVRQVRAKSGRKLAYTTIMTTLDRLHRKGLVRRTREGLAYLYRPALTRDELHRRIVEKTVGALLHETPQPVLAAFVDAAATIDEKNLERLERLIAEKKKRGRS